MPNSGKDIIIISGILAKVKVLRIQRYCRQAGNIHAEVNLTKKENGEKR